MFLTTAGFGMSRTSTNVVGIGTSITMTMVVSEWSGNVGHIVGPRVVSRLPGAPMTSSVTLFSRFAH